MHAPDALAIQDFYPADYAVCYGCGRLNAHGLHVRTVFENAVGTAHYTPRPEHTGVAGFVYGGLLASLIDCHALGTAAAASEVADGRAIGAAPAPRFVTGALHVEFLKPTPLGPTLELGARVVETSPRKAIVEVTVIVAGNVTVTGRVVAVRLPPTMSVR